jgi:hypothetical protein
LAAALRRDLHITWCCHLLIIIAIPGSYQRAFGISTEFAAGGSRLCCCGHGLFRGFQQAPFSRVDVTAP